MVLEADYIQNVKYKIFYNMRLEIEKTRKELLGLFGYQELMLRQDR